MNERITYIMGIMGSNKEIKIGHTEDLKIRLSQLQIGNPKELYYIFTTKKYTEKDLKKRFKKYRKRGEWFYYSDEIKDFIKQKKPEEVKAPLLDALIDAYLINEEAIGKEIDKINSIVSKLNKYGIKLPTIQ